ncbi:MAG: mandelate racemase [Burkholderiales bacterium]|nr:mandelate racemase [Burkholderiales bacterium]
MHAPRFTVVSIEAFERDVRLRMPFRFGVVTLTAAPQAFVRATIRLADGTEASGAAAELLAPKWFDKDPALSNEDNFDQLRRAVHLARIAYADGEARSAVGHFAAHHAAHAARCAAQGLNGLVAGFGPALVDRALLDALCRALGVPFSTAVREDRIGLAAHAAALAPELEGFDVGAFLAALRPAASIAARHTVGLVDRIVASDAGAPVGDGLPETLEEVVARYGHRWFKLKVGGDVAADVERLSAIASVLDRIPEPYRASLDGNEQYDDVDGVVALWRAMQAEPRLRRLVDSVVFIEQPIRRSSALSRDIGALAAERPVIVDESDDTLDAFARARALGYVGVSSKTCKGLYKSMLNAARCARWNAEAGSARCFMSAEDLTIQAGLALQQDLALVSLLGITHVERNGHHYVDGMAALPAAEQQAFLDAHPDLYERSHGAVRVRIRDGSLAIGSLDAPGFASGAMPAWDAMRALPDGWHQKP